MTRVLKAFLWFVAGVVAAVAGGIALSFGILAGWVLVALGGVVGCFFLLFYDIDETKPEVRP
jgi:hypothetical protein